MSAMEAIRLKPRLQKSSPASLVTRGFGGSGHDAAIGCETPLDALTHQSLQDEITIMASAERINPWSTQVVVGDPNHFNLFAIAPAADHLAVGRSPDIDKGVFGIPG